LIACVALSNSTVVVAVPRIVSPFSIAVVKAFKLSAVLA
jgi:hypothetical protein